MREQFFAFHKLRDNNNLGVLLLDFFRLYGGSFNLYHTGISLADGGSYFRKRERNGDWYNPKRPNLLCIQNPFFPDQDIGRNSFQITKIRRSFETAKQVLECVIADSQNISYLSFIIRKEHPSVTVSYNWSSSVSTSLKSSSFVSETKNLYSSSSSLSLSTATTTNNGSHSHNHSNSQKSSSVITSKSSNNDNATSRNNSSSSNMIAQDRDHTKSPRKSITTVDDIFELKNSADGSSSSSSSSDDDQDKNEDDQEEDEDEIEELYRRGFTKNKFSATLPDATTQASSNHGSGGSNKKKKRRGKKKRRTSDQSSI